MDAARHARIRELFDAAADLPAEQRNTFLAQACSDPEVLERVRSLLQSHQDADEFLSTPAADLTSLHTLTAETRARNSGPDPLVNFTLGQYRLTSVLGAGGMGIVYAAEQRATRRPVAIKVVRAALADVGLLRRFQQESLVLGRLKHPGIAQIYEAGSAPGPDGRDLPFYAMELVNGRPIIEYFKTLLIKDRLELFSRVCDAVSHAHQKGVIHRDLKPGNILVEELEGGTSAATSIGAQPKILDFGVARLIDPDVAATMQTAVGQVIGTLAYMSPEQIRGETEHLDTRSDIYSLGVILCELLTGQLPYSVRGKPLAQAARIVSEEDPTINTAAERLLRGDIETIIQKALSKEPERRYQSAAEFAADIRRHLGNLPIVARPATATYQLRKFASRNRGLVGGVIATILMLVLGVIGTTVGMMRAQEAKTLAERREKRAIAEARKASKSIEFLTDMLTASRPEDALGRDVTVRELLDTASSRVDRELAQDPDVLASVQDSIGRTYLSLGKADAAEPHLRGAASKRKEVFGEDSREYAASLEALAALAGARKSFKEQAEILTTNLEIRSRGAAADDFDLAIARQLLGVSYLDLGRYDEALPLLRSAVGVLEKSGSEHRKDLAKALVALASTLLRNGPNNDLEAKEINDRSLAIFRELYGNMHPDVADGLFAQGFLLLNMKDPAAAEEKLRECLAIRTKILAPDHPKVLSARNTLGTALIQQQKLDAAETELTEVLALRQKSLGPNHADVGRTLEELAALAARRKDVARQEQLLTEAVKILRLEGGIRFANSAHDLALLKSRIGKPAEAERLFLAALDVRRTLGQHSTNMAILISDYGWFLHTQERFSEALLFLKEASEALNTLVPEGANTATTDRRLGATLAELGQQPEASEAFERAVRVARASKNQNVLANVIAAYATVLEKWNMPEKAKDLRETLPPAPPAK